MEYTREHWQPRIATNPNRFRKLNESTDYVELINEPEAITQAGTAFTADRLNNMESGIAGAVAGVNEIQGVVDFTNMIDGLSGLGQLPRDWHGMTTRSYDVYACVLGGDIYKQTNGVGDFIALGQTSRLWRGMTTLGNDVYACVYGGDIYKQTNGTGDFIALGQTSRYWHGMTTRGNDVYACENGGDIYKQTGGVGDFISLGQTSRGWFGMTTRGNDVYACVHSGDIYKQTNGVGGFISLGQTSRGWHGMTTLGNDVYACVLGGDIYKQTGGTGDFIALGQETRNWRGMTTLDSVLYACVYSGDIYTTTILTGNTFRASASFTLPAMPDGARKRILNTHATNAITVTAYSGTTIEGQATMTLSAGHEVEIELIWTDWRKVVLSQSVTPSAGKAMVWPDSSIKVWRSDNDGSGSGLDADLFDGLNSDRFVYLDNKTQSLLATDANAITKSGLQRVANTAANLPIAQWGTIYTNIWDGNGATQLYIALGDSSVMYIRIKSGGTWRAWNKFWNEANDGAGSGLETDKIPFGTKTGTSTGSQGQASFDANYLYLCTATNVWKRVALTSF